MKQRAGIEATALSSLVAGTQEWSRRLPVVFVSAVFLGLALRLFQLIDRYAVNIFFSDQWDFNRATLFESHSLWEMFRWQHGSRQGLGALVSYPDRTAFSVEFQDGIVSHRCPGSDDSTVCDMAQEETVWRPHSL